jgi:hypothetical protein
MAAVSDQCRLFANTFAALGRGPAFSADGETSGSSTGTSGGVGSVMVPPSECWPVIGSSKG